MLIKINKQPHSLPLISSFLLSRPWKIAKVFPPSIVGIVGGEHAHGEHKKSKKKKKLAVKTVNL